MRIRGRRTYFSGRYNDAKGRMMLVFYQYPQEWFTPRRIHAITGVKLCSARAQCRRMYVIRLENTMQPPYLERRLIGNRFTQYYYEYKLAPGGKKWVIGAIAAGMPIDKYIQEAETSASTNKDGTLTIYKNINPRGSPPLAAN